MKKQFFITAVALTLATSSLVAQDEINSPTVELTDTTPTTYMSVALELLLTLSFRDSRSS